MKNHYQTLGLTNCAPMDDVRRAFRALALRHHPDRGGDSERMKEINAAYDYLLKHKAEYDRQLRPERSTLRGFTIHVGGWGNATTMTETSEGFSFVFNL